MNKKGFTLIELLAVIIILGILMLIAIPSVTNYINNSRKESYIDTAKEIIKGATILVNSGELEINDPETTYYIPCTCITTENKMSSPFGDFDPAYIIATYDNNTYSYYWMSRDTQGIGIKDIISSDELKSDYIVSNISANDIAAKYGLDGRGHIIEFNSDCSSYVSKTAEKLIASHERFPNQSPGTLMVGSNGPYGIFGKNITKNVVERIIFEDSKIVPDNAIDSWDVSVEHDGSIMAWFLDDDENAMYELHIGQDGGVRANPDSKYALSYFYRAKYIDVTKLNTSEVIDMSHMFDATGYSSFEADNEIFRIIGLENFDTSKVQTMDSMFYWTGRTTRDWSIGKLDSWDVSSVKTFSHMFYRAAYNARGFDIGNIGYWNVSETISMDHMFYSAGYGSYTWSIGDLSNWNPINVVNMESMFGSAANFSSTYTKSFGTLNVYADNISGMFNGACYLSGEVNLYRKPTSYNGAFNAYYGNSTFVVNYASEVTNIDDIIASSYSSTRVAKGRQLD